MKRNAKLLIMKDKDIANIKLPKQKKPIHF